ncbi:TPA: hypothetical protein N0F65_010718 [Lagenidium giganteum]|uniref:AAA+ ATPase domain-containing protein n=1 Tax=Lagenidium giganteum TaxID=4803 RepID=A0AAV2YL49_9STRA|nr:TPA: hypothetical protein N0F65_010718 [Lagenidium giganteum]
MAPEVSEKFKAWVKLWVLGTSDRGFVVREIESTLQFSEYSLSNYDEESTNARSLQKAVAIHIADLLQLRGKDVLYELLEKPLEQLTKEELKKEEPAGDNDSDDNYTGDGDDDEDDDEISRLRVTTLPNLNVWVPVQPGIWFQREVKDDSEEGGEKTSKSKTVTILFKFRTNLPQKTAAIDELVQAAFQKYQDLEIKRVDTDETRYMFVQTLEQVSSSEKEQMLHLLDNFTNGTGRFAIKGFPRKLGLLLHGPPGTGKTSLIKAVAQYTKRHIVTISLSKIKTNQELMDAIFDLRFKVQDIDSPMTMTFKDVVFVMEDIDAASSVVTKRNGPQRRIRRPRRAQWSSSTSKDKLNLSGLLNVLDGVIDCPERIVIMTTNHPDKLDPALVRPGRVNKKLLLGYMVARDIRAMLEYYFDGKMSADQFQILEEYGDARFTPAEIEELCLEYDDFDGALHQLRKVSERRRRRGLSRSGSSFAM